MMSEKENANNMTLKESEKECSLRTNLDLTKLEKTNRSIILSIYYSLIRNQNKKGSGTLKSSLKSIKKILEKEEHLNEKTELDEKRKYLAILDPIQKEILTEWSSIDPEEQAGIKDLFVNWQINIEKNFNSICPTNKSIPSLDINEKKLIGKGLFNFKQAKENLENIQVEILKACMERNQDLEVVTKRNTRLILRSYYQLLSALNFLYDARIALIDSEPVDLRLYWKSLSKFLLSISKSIFRFGFYVHELSCLSVCLLPIYILESDESNNPDIPQITIENLYHYLSVCLNQLAPETKSSNKRIKNNRKNSQIKMLKNKTTILKNILKSLMRIVQLCSMMRDNLMMKHIKYTKGFNVNGVVDIDIYSHFITNEFKLITRYLRETLN